MKLKAFTVALVAIVAAPALARAAEDVVVKDTHMCCGACIKTVGKVLGRVKGVTDAACDKDAKTIKFKADNAKVARQALRRLAVAGFYGKVSVGGKEAKFPARGPKKGAKSDKYTLIAHNCCPGCLGAIKKAATSVDGVDSVSANKNMITVSGKQFSVAKLVGALNKSGFSGIAPRKKNRRRTSRSLTH